MMNLLQNKYTQSLSMKDMLSQTWGFLQAKLFLCTSNLVMSPFLAEVDVPSPCSTHKSSILDSNNCSTEASNILSKHP